MFPALAGRFLTTGPPGSPPPVEFLNRMTTFLVEPLPFSPVPYYGPALLIMLFPRPFLHVFFSPLVLKLSELLPSFMYVYLSHFYSLSIQLIWRSWGLS